MNIGKYQGKYPGKYLGKSSINGAFSTAMSIGKGFLGKPSGWNIGCSWNISLINWFLKCGWGFLLAINQLYGDFGSGQQNQQKMYQLFQLLTISSSMATRISSYYIPRCISNGISEWNVGI